MEQKAYKIFIIEDSDKDRELLEKSLASYNLFQVVGCLPGGSGALALIQRLHPDLLFIDVELPGLPGYEIVNKLHEVVMWDMKVVFTLLILTICWKRYEVPLLIFAETF